MLGKIVFRVNEGLGGEITMGGADAVLVGDLKQATPIGDDPISRTGKYGGRGLNRPVKGEPVEGTPSLESLTARGDLFRDEFHDVVILQQVHRISKTSGSDAVASLDASAEAAEYAAAAEHFLTVTAKMADCE